MTTQLPPQNPSEPDEKLPGEAELAALCRQLPAGEPSPVLDAAVLRAAAQALASDEESPTVLRERRRAAREGGDWVHPQPPGAAPTAAPFRASSKPRWLIALSTAASLVLAAGLAWHMREPPAATSAPAALDSAPAQVVAPSPPAARQMAEAVPPPPPEPPKQPPPERLVAAKPAPTTRTVRKAVAEQSAEHAAGNARMIGDVGHDSPAPMAAPAAPSVMLQEVSGNVVAAPEMRAMMAAPLASAPPVDDTMPNRNDTPAQELHKIQQLFAQDRDTEAHQRLITFQRAHPQWHLPADLRKRLRKP